MATIKQTAPKATGNKASGKSGATPGAKPKVAAKTNSGALNLTFNYGSSTRNTHRYNETPEPKERMAIALYLPKNMVPTKGEEVPDSLVCSVIFS